MSDADAELLFAGTGFGKRDAPASAEVSITKRINLRRTDHLVAQCLQPYDVSPVEEISYVDLFNFAKKGNKYVVHYSELCSDDAYKVGVGLSRHAHLLLKAGEMLKDATFAAVVDKTMLSKATTAFNTLEPSLKLLDVGTAALRTSGTGVSSMSSLKRASGVVPEAAALEKAAKALYKYYAEPSPLRAILSILGKGGVAFNVLVAERMAVAYVKAGKATEEDFVKAMAARVAAGSSETQNEEDGSIMALVGNKKK